MTIISEVWFGNNIQSSPTVQCTRREILQAECCPTCSTSEEKDIVFIPVEMVLDKLSDWESVSIETVVSKQDRKAASCGVLCTNRHSVSLGRRRRGGSSGGW